MAGGYTARTGRLGRIATSDQVFLRSFTPLTVIDGVETSAATVAAFLSAGWVPNTLFLKAGSGGFYLPMPTSLSFIFSDANDTLTCDIVGRNHLNEPVSEQIVVAGGTQSVRTLHVYRWLESITPTAATTAVAGTFTIGWNWITGDRGAVSVPIPIKIQAQSNVVGIYVTELGGAGNATNLDEMQVITDADAPTTAGTLEAAVSVAANAIQILTTSPTQPTTTTEWGIIMDQGFLKYT